MDQTQQPAPEGPASAAPRGELGPLLAAIGTAVEQYAQASARRVAELQAETERSCATRLGELLGPVLARLQHVETAVGELFALAERLEQRTAGLVGWADELGAGVADGRTAQADLDERLTLLAAQVAGVDAARLGGLADRLGDLAARVDGVDATRLDALDERLTATVGEATIARIELDRLGGRIGDRLDTLQVRVGELEGQVAEQMDVSVAVQLERLDELERAVIELDPHALVHQA